MTHIEAARPQFRAVVFKRSSPTSDFTCSEALALPGLHTEQDAWAAVRAAMIVERCIGGEVLPAPADLPTG